jgi:periplasmic protein TonB
MNKVCTLLIIISVLISLCSYGQTKRINAGGIEMQVSAADASLNDAFCSVGEMPVFPGGTTKLVTFAKSKIKYPQTAVNDSVQGSVILLFTIDKKGRVTDKKVFKSVRQDLDKVCLRMLSQMPNWKAGRLAGKPIAVFERWKITFVLTD